MSAMHMIYIPGVFLLGMVVGYLMGASAARKALDRARERLRR